MRIPLSLIIVAVWLAGCTPGDVLDVPAPTAVVPAGAVASQGGAEQIEANGVWSFALAFSEDLSGVLEWSGLLSDEFRWGFIDGSGSDAGVDARMTEGARGFSEPGDNALQMLMATRLTLLTVLPALQRYEPSSGRPKIGLAFALVGYSELLAAEDYCAGLPLATPTSTGVVYGIPLTTDSLFGVAEAHFDSALVYAGNDPVVMPLASVGLARARLNRGNFDGAAVAASAAPTGFVYNAELSPVITGYGATAPTSNVWDMALLYYGCGSATPTNNKGQNGLNYLSANDPRLVFDSSLVKTCDGAYSGLADSVWYDAVKFGNPSSAVPIATGVEARLIEAEAALHAGRVATWASDLNTLRANAPGTYLALANGVPPLTADSTTAGSASRQVDVMFRERAFWLYGMGSRLGDMRRLIRQYGRDQATVFPVGPYPYASTPGLPGALPTYGTEVNLTLPTAGSGLTDPNPNYKGCISRGA